MKTFYYSKRQTLPSSTFPNLTDGARYRKASPDMVGAQCAITSFPKLSAISTTNRSKTTISKRPLVVVSSSKLTNRKNYLRPKILKTLKKTSPAPNTTIILPIPHPAIPIESDELPHQEEVVGGEFHPVVAVEDGEEAVQVSETSGTVGTVSSKFSTRSVLKLGLYLVGIFVFQTICAVWFLGSSNTNSDQEQLENEDKNKLLLDGNGNGKFALKPGGGFVYVDELELEKKIVEIRAMAKEARRTERRTEAKNNGFDDGSANLIVKKSGIEKEVNTRLVKLKKKLDSSIQEKSGGGSSSVGYLSKSGKVEVRINKDSLDTKQLNGALVLEKKHKFRSQFTKQRNDPKGSRGFDDRNESVKEKSSGSAVIDVMLGSTSIGSSNGLDTLDQGKQRGKELKYLQNDLNKLEKQNGTMGVANAKENTGLVQESSHARHMNGTNKSRISNELETQKSFGFTKENQDVTSMPNKRTVLSRNGSSKGRKVGNKPVANKVRDKQSNTKNDIWWLKLPYVLAILLRRGDPEAPGGLYTLDITSQTLDKSDSSYIVAFEDRGDANNFCYLLESFFEDLGDFSADIVPLFNRELKEAVQSRTVELIVVKKGQLQLYAGQPLVDVEMKLQILAEQ